MTVRAAVRTSMGGEVCKMFEQTVHCVGRQYSGPPKQLIKAVPTSVRPKKLMTLWTLKLCQS